MARGYRRKRFYSTPKRILAHLSSTSAHEPGTLTVLTQEGIAAATHSGRTTVTKWLTRMESTGLVAGERAHVPGHRVRKTVYRLSHEGWVQAMKLRTRFQGDIVEVLAPGLDPTPMRVAEIPDIFPGFVNLTAAVSLVRRGRLDFTKLHGIGSGAVAPILWGDTLRRLGRVFGRTEEFRILDAWASSSSSVLVASGIAGIGKSTLVASWLVRQRPRPYIFWFEIHEGTTRGIFLRDLAAFLARLGRRGLKNLQTERRAEAPQVTARVLAHDLRDLPILLVLDNYQRAIPELASLVVGPILGAGRGGSGKVVLISRTLPSAPVRRKASKTTRIEILRVGGLDPDASLALLRAKGFAGDEITLQRVANSARGHPILLSFAAQTGSTVGREITRYLEREIWHTLTKDEQTILEAASLFRGLVPSGALPSYCGEWQAAIKLLQAKNLIAPTISGGVVVHDTIREWIHERLPRAKRRSIHFLAATYFLDGSEVGDPLEGMYHLIESGNVKAFGEYLVSHDAGLLDSVPASELLTLLRTMGSAVLDPRPACILPEVAGDALKASGDLRPALLQYRHALQRAESNSQVDRIPRLLRKIASIERCRNEHAKALGHLIESQARLKVHPNPAESGEILREMALLERAKGRLAEAATLMNAAVDHATEASDSGALSRSLTALGSIEHDRGKIDRGLAYRLEGLRIAERAGNLTETARACISVGASYHALKRYEESLKFCDRALQLASLVGNLRLVAYARMNRSASLLDMGGRARETTGEIAEAKRLVQILEEPDTLALLGIYEGQREFELGRWSRATRLWEQGLQGLREYGEPSDLARSLVFVGRFHMENAATSAARRYLDEAYDLALRLSNEALLSEIKPLLGVVGSPTESTTARRTGV